MNLVQTTVFCCLIFCSFFRQAMAEDCSIQRYQQNISDTVIDQLEESLEETETYNYSFSVDVSNSQVTIDGSKQLSHGGQTYEIHTLGFSYKPLNAVFDHTRAYVSEVVFEIESVAADPLNKGKCAFKLNLTSIDLNNGRGKQVNLPHSEIKELVWIPQTRTKASRVYDALWRAVTLSKVGSTHCTGICSFSTPWCQAPDTDAVLYRDWVPKVNDCPILAKNWKFG